MYGCECWTIKKAEHQRIDAFELWCWSILKEISPEYSLAGLMLKLKLQFFAHLMWRTDFLKRPWSWERLKAGEEGDYGRWDGWMTSLIQWTWVWQNSRSWWWTRRPGMLQSMGSQRAGHDWVTGLNWTKAKGLACHLEKKTFLILKTLQQSSSSQKNKYKKMFNVSR